VENKQIMKKLFLFHKVKKTTSSVSKLNLHTKSQRYIGFKIEQIEKKKVGQVELTSLKIQYFEQSLKHYFRL